jgi:hypothetical protein
MKAIRTILFLIIVLIASGCSSLKMTSYPPSILMEGTGTVKVNGFRYLPGDKGVVKNNEIDTVGGLYKIYTEVDIKNYVADAVSKELKFIGYKLDPNSSIIISGDIKEWSCNYLGYFTTADVKAKIEFVIVNNDNGKAKEVYRKVHEGIYSTKANEVTDYQLTVNEGLRRCIKSFIEDAQKKKIL